MPNILPLIFILVADRGSQASDGFGRAPAGPVWEAKVGGNLRNLSSSQLQGFVKKSFMVSVTGFCSVAKQPILIPTAQSMVQDRQVSGRLLGWEQYKYQSLFCNKSFVNTWITHCFFSVEFCSRAFIQMCLNTKGDNNVIIICLVSIFDFLYLWLKCGLWQCWEHLRTSLDFMNNWLLIYIICLDFTACFEA